MKHLDNSEVAQCTECFQIGHILEKGSTISCAFCGGQNFTNALTGAMFQPHYGSNEVDTFQSSPYTPKLPERRKAHTTLCNGYDRRNQ